VPLNKRTQPPLTIRAIAYKAEEGGWWAEVPSIPGCGTQAETLEELERNLAEAIRGCLSVDVEIPPDKEASGKAQVLSVAV
jgi:predicted RNase H-like HicB family nuclease